MATEGGSGEDEESPLSPFFDCWAQNQFTPNVMGLIEAAMATDVNVYMFAPPWIDDDPGALYRLKGHGKRDVATAFAWKNQLSGQRYMSGTSIVRKGRSWFEIRVKVRTVGGRTIESVEGVAFRLREGKVSSILRKISWSQWREELPVLAPAPEEEQEQGRGQQQQSGPPTTGHVPPCTHNDWDNIRGRKTWSQLRCRACSSLWRIPEPRPVHLSVCPMFRESTCTDEHCGRLHIHKQRLTAPERHADPQPPPPGGQAPARLHTPSPDTDSSQSTMPSTSQSLFRHFLDRVEESPFGWPPSWPPLEPEVTPTLIADEKEAVRRTQQFLSPTTYPPYIPPLLAAASVQSEPPPLLPSATGEGGEGSPGHLELAREFARLRDAGMYEQMTVLLDEEVVVEAPMLLVKGTNAMMAALSMWSRELEGATEFAHAGGSWYARTIRVRMGSMLQATVLERCSIDTSTGLITAITLSPFQGQ
eukprot:Hpha_TRINITY_DN15776_c2_g5::TRINITY_DN15776_c2_g5_i1::g.38694::m.38694